MARRASPPKQPQNTYQSSFLEQLEQNLAQQRGELIPLAFNADDIGATLLAILSKGLYTNPLDCIREYIQNAVDADVKSVTIKITGNSVSIFDEGNGMDLADLVQARQFGLSLKSLSDHVGFRGIGIYSGFDLCKRLRITSTKEGDPNLHVLVFEFAAMKEILDRELQQRPGETRTSLSKLLSDHTYIKREPGQMPVERHFTQVELQDISDTHIRQLSNRAELKRYLLQNLPIDFADDFQYKQIINEQLYQHVQGYNAITVILQSDGQPDDIVAKEALLKIKPPTFGYIETISGQRLAYYWACLTDDRGRIQPVPRDKNEQRDVLPSYEGFVYKVKGFTIGDRQKLRAAFLRKPQLYPWYTGEIYVIDNNIIPNAERYDFETNQAKVALNFAVNKKLSELEEVAEQYQAQEVADERIADYTKEFIKIEEQVDTNTQEDSFATFSRLDEILKDIRRQKSKASEKNRSSADDLIKRAERLKRALRKGADTPVPEAKQRTRAVRNEHVLQRAPVPTIQPPPPTPPKTLPGILSDINWDVERDSVHLIALIQESLENVFGINSTIYHNILTDIEARIISAMNGEDV